MSNLAQQAETVDRPTRPRVEPELPLSMELKFVGRRDRSAGGSPGWLSEIREMRGRIIYDSKRRPQFLRQDGSFDDSDPVDLEAYHLIARLQGRAVGCARIVPLRDRQPSTVASTVGPERFDRILSEIGTVRERTCEASRWLIVPECRGHGLGALIVAASGAVVRWLTLDGVFVLAGTREHQDKALIRLGARAMPDLPLFSSPVFDDELRLLYFEAAHASQAMEKKVSETAKLLKLDSMLPLTAADHAGDSAKEPESTTMPIRSGEKGPADRTSREATGAAFIRLKPHSIGI